MMYSCLVVSWHFNLKCFFAQVSSDLHFSTYNIAKSFAPVGKPALLIYISVYKSNLSFSVLFFRVFRITNWCYSLTNELNFAASWRTLEPCDFVIKFRAPRLQLNPVSEDSYENA
ncbi:unnamed protein product [Clavelina lepadiformis]|uniref:Uncharacterized protein n=1 Tax=Clavelina lepadiformis TaxID=159417 RepID=A0ABP0FUF1_CLALP